MSIATSVLVRPSRSLFLMVAAMCAMTMSIGLTVLFAPLGELPQAMRFAAAVFTFFLAFFGFYHTARNRKALQLDISGTGQIRITEKTARARTCQAENWPHVTERGMPVRLLKDSTIWSNLLLLRLQAETGETTVVPILPDSVSRDGFRALSVACRWIAAHDGPSEQKNL